MDDRSDEGVAAATIQVAKVLSTLGQSGAGRRAIIKAVAERQGVVDEDALEEMYAGKSDIKLKVSLALREAMCSIGLGSALAAPVNMLTTRDGDSILVSGKTWNSRSLWIPAQ